MADLIEITLEGGPPAIPSVLQVERAALHEGKVKIPHCGGYEHFQIVEEQKEAGHSGRTIFRWTLCTKIAE